MAHDVFPNLQIFKYSSLADDSKQKAIIKNKPSEANKHRHSERIQCDPSWRAQRSNKNRHGELTK